MVVVECPANKIKKYTGKLMSGDQRVYLNIIVKNETELKDIFEYLNITENIKYITIRDFKEYIKLPEIEKETKSVPIFYEIPYGIFNVEELQEITEKGYICLIKLSGNLTEMETPNLRDIYRLSKTIKNIRFIGGTIVELEGIKVGLSDEEKENMGGVYKDTYDSFTVTTLKDIKNLEIIKSKFKKETRITDSSVSVKENKDENKKNTVEEKVIKKKENVKKKSKDKKISILFAIGGGEKEDDW